MDCASKEQFIPASQPPGLEPARGLSGAGAAGGLFGVPARFWTRLLLIWVALCGVKCGILLSLRKELFQVHWRIMQVPPNWVNFVAFGAFVLLVGLNLWVFARKCAAKGDASVRLGFALVLALAAVFLCLTFHEGDKNYLSPILRGTLRFADLWAYFSMNLFFRAPWLAAWVGGLVLLYYVMLRTGREKLMLHAFAVLAPVYLLLNLCELAHFKAELLALDALGVACLVFGNRLKRALRWPLAFAPYALMVAGFLLFSSFDKDIARPNPDVSIPLFSGAVLFLGATLLIGRRGFFDAWSWFLPFASASFALLTTANFQLADSYRALLLNGLTLPRYFVDETIFTGVLLLAVVVLHRWRPLAAQWTLDVLGLAGVALAIVDWRLTRVIGTRLDWQVIAFADSPKMIWRMAKPYLPLVFVAVCSLVALGAVVLRLSGRRQKEPGYHRTLLSVGGQFAVIGAMLLGFVGVGFVGTDKARGATVSLLMESSPWWKRVSEPKYSAEQFARKVRDLGLESMLQPASPQPARARRELNVVLIFQESVYNQHLSLFGGTNETQPLLSQYKDRMELFPNFFSNFAGSIHARFATFTGLYPVHDFKLFTKNPVPVRSLFEVLRDQGYECPVFYSSFADYTNFRDLLRSHGVEQLYDADSMPGPRTSEPVAWGLKEEETLGAIKQQISAYAVNGRKFFLTYVPAAPHNPFDGVPERFRKFKSDVMGDFTPRYLNELLYMDWVIASILDQLKETGQLDRTLVVITSDHGEMLGAGGAPIGHGWALTPELANVPLMIMDPQHQGGRINPAVGSQVDLLPTVLDLLGIPLPPNELYQGRSLYRAEAGPCRTVYLNTFRQFATLNGTTFTSGDRQVGNDAAVKAFAITNHEARSLFLPADPAPAPADINCFDNFQENFLAHYRDYVRLLRTGSVQ
jgi:hypothetical protein